MIGLNKHLGPADLESIEILAPNHIRFGATMRDGRSLISDKRVRNYYEVTIQSMSKGLAQESYIATGFACRPYPPFRLPGWADYSLAVNTKGHVVVNEERGEGVIFTEPFGVGDVVGCGYWQCEDDDRFDEFFFTLNGTYRGVGVTTDCLRNETYACIGIMGNGVVDINFGTRPFAWEAANTVQRQIGNPIYDDGMGGGKGYVGVFTDLGTIKNVMGDEYDGGFANDPEFRHDDENDGGNNEKGDGRGYERPVGGKSGNMKGPNTMGAKDPNNPLGLELDVGKEKEGKYTDGGDEKQSASNVMPSPFSPRRRGSIVVTKSGIRSPGGILPGSMSNLGAIESGGNGPNTSSSSSSTGAPSASSTTLTTSMMQEKQAAVYEQHQQLRLQQQKQQQQEKQHGAETSKPKSSSGGSSNTSAEKRSHHGGSNGSHGSGSNGGSSSGHPSNVSSKMARNLPPGAASKGLTLQSGIGLSSTPRGSGSNSGPGAGTGVYRQYDTDVRHAAAPTLRVLDSMIDHHQGSSSNSSSNSSSSSSSSSSNTNHSSSGVGNGDSGGVKFHFEDSPRGSNAGAWPAGSSSHSSESNNAGNTTSTNHGQSRYQTSLRPTQTGDVELTVRGGNYEAGQRK